MNIPLSEFITGMIIIAIVVAVAWHGLSDDNPYRGKK